MMSDKTDEEKSAKGDEYGCGLCEHAYKELGLLQCRRAVAALWGPEGDWLRGVEKLGRNPFDMPGCTSFELAVNIIEQRVRTASIGTCSCGDARVVIVDEGNNTFRDRTGCSTCDTWDTPVVLK